MKRLLSFILVICFVVSAAPALSYADASADISLSIKACNLVFEDSVRLLFAVSASGTDSISLAVWDSKPADYNVSSAKRILSPLSERENIGGTQCYVFKYNDLSAKQMTDTVYAVAYTTVNGQTYCSDVCRYSIIEHAVNMRAKDDTEASYLALLTQMLSFGAAAQSHFSYRTDRLATDTYSRIKVVGGVIDGSFSHGIYKAGETAVITAQASDSDGKAFDHWQNSSGNNVGTDQQLTVTAGTADETYTAVYAAETPTPPPAQYTVTWNASEDENATIIVYRNNEELKNGDTVNLNEQLTVSYGVNEGEIISKGSESITVTGNVGPRDIYCISSASYGEYTVKFRTTDGKDLNTTATCIQRPYSTAVPHCEFPEISGYTISDSIPAVYWGEGDIYIDIYVPVS